MANLLKAVLLFVIFYACSTNEKNLQAPEEILGNWFDISDGSWEFGIEKDFLIAENKFWTYQAFIENEDKFIVTVVSNERTKQFVINKSKAGRLQIGESGKELRTYTNQKELVKRKPENNTVSQQPGPVTISGYIRNYSKYRDSVSSISVLVHDLYLGLPQYHYSDIDSLGRFQLTFEAISPQDVRLIFNGRWPELFVVPNDTLMVYMDSDKYGKPDNSTHFMGRYADVNSNMINYWHYYEESLPSYKEQYSKVFRLDQQAYKAYRKDYLNQERGFLKNYCATNNCSDLFIAWFDQNIKYRYYRTLMKYPRENVTTLEEYKERFFPYENYYSFLDSIQYDDPMARMASSFGLMVHEIGNMKYRHSKVPNLDAREKQYREKIVDLMLQYATEVPPHDRFSILAISEDESIQEKLEKHPNLEEINEALLKNRFDSFIFPLLEIEDRSLRELLVARTYYQHVIDMKQYDLLDYGIGIVEQEISDPTIKDMLMEGYQSVKELGKVLDESEFKENITLYLEDSSGEELLKKLRTKHAGKIIYVDFWATWCKPCLEDMNEISPIKQYFQNKDLVFVYVCSDSRHKMWQKRLKELGLEGEHYFLSKKTSTDLYRKFNIVGIPRYILIDTEGNIADEHAPRPTQKEQLIFAIEQLL